LCPFSKKTKVCRNYYQGDGLQSDEFNINAYCKSSADIMYFGGIHGISSFFPDSIKEKRTTPKSVLTQLSIFNQIIKPGQEYFGSQVLHKNIEYTSDFLRIIRLKKATELLAGDESNISQVVYQTGFNDPSYFTKCFKKQFGLTPSEYMNRKVK